MENKKNINFCYKIIYCKDGVSLLFERFDEFTPSDIKINYYNGEIYVELGNNIFLLTKSLIDRLIETPKIFVHAGAICDYEISNYIGEFEIDMGILAQIKGAVLVIESKQAEDSIIK